MNDFESSSNESRLPDMAFKDDTKECASPPSRNSLQVKELSTEEYRNLTIKLSEQLKAITLMNGKWQKYNDEREKYVDSMRRDLKNTKKELSETRAREIQLEKTTNEQQKTIQDQQNTISNFSKLMDDLDEKEERVRTLVMRVRELEGRQDRSENDSESVRLLQQQLEVCIDDFKTEKREKEKYRHEAHTLRKTSMEKDSLLQEYQDKIALIKSLEFPPVPREYSTSYENTRRKSSAHARRQNYVPPKTSSWSYPLDVPTIFGSIEADCDTGGQGSQIDGTLKNPGGVGGMPIKPLFELFPHLKESVEKTESSFGSDNVFTEDSDELEGELVRR